MRKNFDYGMEHFLNERPVLFAITVTTAAGREIYTKGLYIRSGRKCLEDAIAKARTENYTYILTC